MKDVNPDFDVAINSPVQRPQFIIKIYMGLDQTDPIYFTSHANTPVPSGVTVYRNVLKGVSGKSQKLNVLKANAEIGTLKFDIIDKQGTITDLFNAKFFDAVLEKALRHREVELYVGYGFDNANYELLFTQRIGGNLGYDGGKYSVTCFDIQREQRKKLFQMKDTRLTSSVRADVTGVDISFNVTGNQINSATTNLSGYVVGEFIRITVSTSNDGYFEVATSTANQITTVEAIVTESIGPKIIVSPATINVLDTSEFLAVDHGVSYTDGSSGKKVGYVRIDKEYFYWEHGNTTSTRFDKVVRGALGSRPAFHEVDSGITDDDRLPKVGEIMHLEMPSLKIDYALKTGVLYNQPGETLPDHWQAGIPTNLVNVSEYLQYADEGLWDSADDTKGQILRFIETKEIECKKFSEERIMRAAGCFNIVRATGALGLIKSTGVIHDAATVATLDESNVRKISNFRYDQKDVYNLFRLKWNYVDGESTREPIVFDNPSQVKYDKSQSMTIPLYGIYGGRHTKNHIANIFDTMRDRYAGSPLKCSVECHTSLGVLEVGDIVQIRLDHIPDHTSVGKTLNRAVEVQRINVDFTKGVTLDLFGSTERSQSILQYTDGTAAGSTFITSQGQDMQTYLETTYGVDVVTDVSVPGVLKIKADCTIPGDPSMSNGIYFYDGAMQINSGVTVTVTHNWQWRFTDLFTNNGDIDGRGNGIAGMSGVGQNPYVNGDPAVISSGYVGYSTGFWGTSQTILRIINNIINDSVVISSSGVHSVADLTLEFNGVSLSGIPDDMRGCAGVHGPLLRYDTSPNDTVDGGDGGSSGVIISDGATGGFGSSINLSGDNPPHPAFYYSPYGRVGGSGWGGCLSIIKLTSLSAVAGIEDSFVSSNGSTESYGWTTKSFIQDRIDRSDSLYVEKFMPTYQVPSTDLPAEADNPATISLTENVNTPQTVAGNLATITVDVTPPTTDGYSYSNIYYRVQGNPAWQFQGPADNQWVIQNLAMTGITYEVAAFPVSTTGVESTDFIMDTITMSTAAGGSVLGTGNYLQTSSTVGNPTVGNGVVMTADGIEGFDSSGVSKVNIDAATGIITAVDANLSGTITASAGAIGGWTINSTSIANASGTLSLDNANDRIRARNGAGTNYVDINSSGIIGFDATLGTTFKLPTDGTPPEFSSGIIKESEYQIYTSGVIKTSANPAATGGILIEQSAIRGYDGGGNQLTLLNGATGEMELTSSISGQKIEINPGGDNEIHFWGDRGDATVEELATIGITTVGGDFVIGNFGTINTTHIAVDAITKGGSAVRGANHNPNNSGFLAAGVSGNSYGNYNLSVGVSGNSTYGYGGFFQCSSINGLSPLLLFPSTSASAPSHTSGKGALWVTSAGILYINTNGATTWQKVGAQ